METITNSIKIKVIPTNLEVGLETHKDGKYDIVVTGELVIGNSTFIFERKKTKYNYIHVTYNNGTVDKDKLQFILDTLGLEIDWTEVDEKIQEKELIQIENEKEALKQAAIKKYTEDPLMNNVDKLVTDLTESLDNFVKDESFSINFTKISLENYIKNNNYSHPSTWVAINIQYKGIDFERTLSYGTSYSWKNGQQFRYSFREGNNSTTSSTKYNNIYIKLLRSINQKLNSINEDIEYKNTKNSQIETLRTTFPAFTFQAYERTEYYKTYSYKITDINIIIKNKRFPIVINGDNFDLNNFTYTKEGVEIFVNNILNNTI